MHRLGISLYPEHSTPEKDLAYMQLAAKYGFSRIFISSYSKTEAPAAGIEVVRVADVPALVRSLFK